MGYSTLKAALDAVVKTNGRQEITGANLNGVMTTILQGVDVLDRANPADTSGMNHVVLKKNKTFAEQVTDTNTIYEIRDTFSLGGATFVIPTGCVLRFNGGKITNGSIDFNGASLYKEEGANIFANISSFSGNVSGHFSPENVSYGLSGDCFSALLTYLKSHIALLKIGTMSLTGDVDLNGVWLDATQIILNGHNLKLGGGADKIKDVSVAYGKGNNQSILSINTNGDRSGSVIIGKTLGCDFHLGHYNGILEFVIDTSNDGIAYSTFYLDAVSSIKFRAESGVTRSWINTNRFVLNRCVSFVVESSLTYFNNNNIQMGCFEGLYNIRLEVGNSNTFDDLRGEATSGARGQIYLGEQTDNNRITIMFYPTGKIYDYGKNNIIRNSVLYYSRLIDKANISLQDLKKGLPSRIMGMSLSQDGTYMIPSNVYDVIGGERYVARYYQTGFIPYKKLMTIFLELDVLAKNEPGLGIAYELYDENFDPIYVTNTGGTAVAMGLLRTTNAGYVNMTAGTYFVAFAMQGNYVPGGSHVVDNNHLLFQFSDKTALEQIEAGDEGVATSLAAVKYITISVVGNTYYHSFDSQLLSVGVSVYEPGFKIRLFNSDVE